MARVLEAPTASYTNVYGDKGMGKSLYARAMVAARINSRGRVVMIDPAGSLAFHGLGRQVTVAQAVAGLAKVGSSAPFAIRVRPEWTEEITDLFRAVYECGRLLLVVDEAHDYGAAGTLDDNFKRLVEKGRNQYIDLCTTAQAPVGLHPRIRSLWDVVVSFRQKDPKYAEKLAEDCFRDPRAAGWLMQLPRFHYLRVDARGVSRGVVSIPTG